MNFGTQGDKFRPTITGINLSNNIVTSSSGTAATFTVSGEDPGGSGLRQVVLQLDHPLQTNSGEVRALTLVDNGSDYVGSLSITVPVTSATAPGIYNIVGATLTDKAGNVRIYSADDLRTTNSLTHFTVDDRTVPTLTALTLPNVDVTNSSTYALVMATVADAGNNVLLRERQHCRRTHLRRFVDGGRLCRDARHADRLCGQPRRLQHRSAPRDGDRHQLHGGRFDLGHARRKLGCAGRADRAGVGRRLFRGQRQRGRAERQRSG